MGFADAVTSALRQYAGFSGRARRSEYWFYYLFFVLAYVAAAILDTITGVPAATLLVIVGLFLPTLAVGVRRLHDTGRSGLWILLNFLPIVGAIVLLVFSIQDSQPGTNEYGPSPKETAFA